MFFDYHQVAGTEMDICKRRSKIVGICKIRLSIGKGIVVEAKHAPNFNDNTFCQSQLVRLFKIVLQSADDNTTEFEGAHFFDKLSGELLHTSPLTSGMCPLPSPRIMVARSVFSARLTEERSAKDLHEVLGHIGFKRMQPVPKLCIGVPEVNRNECRIMQCVPCITAATKRAPLQSVTSVASHQLELIHTDISGPINRASIARKGYMDVFLDDHTRMSMVYFLDHKSEFFKTLKGYQSLVENEQLFKTHPNAPGLRMFRIRLDRVGEHSSLNVHTHAMENGIILEYSPPYGTQSNGAAESLIQEL